MARWSVDQVLALAPDDAARRAAQAVASPRPWSELGSTASLVWGRCQGSGKAPYQVTVDLDEPAFRCTCPSRKLPCKHGLALLLLWARGDGSVADASTAAPFAEEWVGERAEREANRADRVARRAAGDLAPADPLASARRGAERDALMTSGLGEFEQWLSDLIRQGVAAARRQPYRYWDEAAARLVDAQLPALAERVRAAGGLIRAQGDWAGRLLAELGRWFVAIRAWPGMADLPPPVAADLRTYLGASRRREEIEAAGGELDRWRVVGVRLGGDDRLRSQRTWLMGETSREWVLLLDFAAVGATLRVAAVVGAVVEATVARYPGAAPARGLFVGDQRVVGSASDIPGAGTVGEALEQRASWLAANPWLERTPVGLHRVTPVVSERRGWVVAADGSALPLDETADQWRLLALTGGRAVDVFGELEADCLHPTTVAIDGELVSL